MGKTNQEIIIKAEPKKVWERIKNFHDMSWAPDVVTSLDKVGEKLPIQSGSKRLINGLFHETLIDLNDSARTFSYSIDDGPSPLSKDEISDYIGIVKVESVPDTDNTRVEWNSSWNNNDETVHDFCHGIYVALLDNMKKSLE